MAQNRKRRAIDDISIKPKKQRKDMDDGKVKSLDSSDWQTVWQKDRVQYPAFRYDFTFYGMECHLQKAAIGHWCGYVRLPDDHPDCGKWIHSHQMRSLDVHGGISSGGGQTYGFDCSWSIFGDVSPGTAMHTPFISEEDAAFTRSLHQRLGIGTPDKKTYWTHEMARAELKKLAKQFYQRYQADEASEKIG